MKIFKIWVGFITHLESYWLKSSNKIENYSFLESSSWIFFSLVKTQRAEDAASLTTLSKRKRKFDTFSSYQQKNREVWLHHFHLAHFHLHPGQTVFSVWQLFASMKQNWTRFQLLWLIKPRFIGKLNILRKGPGLVFIMGFIFVLFCCHFLSVLTCIHFPCLLVNPGQYSAMIQTAKEEHLIPPPWAVKWAHRVLSQQELCQHSSQQILQWSAWVQWK